MCFISRKPDELAHCIPLVKNEFWDCCNSCSSFTKDVLLEANGHYLFWTCERFFIPRRELSQFLISIYHYYWATYLKLVGKVTLDNILGNGAAKVFGPFFNHLENSVNGQKMIKVTKYIPTIMRENHTHRGQIFKKHSINELKMCRSKKLRTKKWDVKDEAVT